MRPVTKLTAGESVVLIDGSTHAIQPVYKPHGTVKGPLSANIGEYCSYCEQPKHDKALEVEHIQPESLPQYKHLRFSWSNFLLACGRCNGKDNKTNKDVVFSNIHLPHLNNTLLSIEYGTGGFVQVHSELTPGSDEYNKAIKLISLVGLDKLPGHPGLNKDKRWLRRDNAWKLATQYELEYQQGKVTIKTIMDLAKGYGFFSVWFGVFEEHPEVRKALIDSFPGTTLSCFDAENGYNPIPRNPPAI